MSWEDRDSEVKRALDDIYRRIIANQRSEGSDVARTHCQHCHGRNCPPLRAEIRKDKGSSQSDKVDLNWRSAA